MKATIEYELPDDEKALIVASCINKILGGASEAHEQLRMLLKHEEDISEKIREKIVDIIKNLYEDTQIIDLV